MKKKKAIKKQPTEKQIAFAKVLGIKKPQFKTKKELSNLIDREVQKAKDAEAKAGLDYVVT